MSKPEDISQEAWDAAIAVFGPPNVAVDVEDIARAIMAAKAEANRDLVDALSDMTEHYVSLAGCGDCGFWDPEQEEKVIAARKMIAAHVSTDHTNKKVGEV